MKPRPTRYDQAGNRHETDAADDLERRPKHRGRVPLDQAYTPGNRDRDHRYDDQGNRANREGGR